MNLSLYRLINEFIVNRDYDSAKAALRQKMDAGDGMAYALYGVYIYTAIFPGFESDAAFSYWEKGAALGDLDCKAFCLFKFAELSYFEEEDLLVMKFTNQLAKGFFGYAQQGTLAYEFLLQLLFHDSVKVDMPERQLLRLLTDGMKKVIQTSPGFLDQYILHWLHEFNQVHWDYPDWMRLFKQFEVFLTPEHPLICYACAAEYLSFLPEKKDQQKIVEWISYIQEPMPVEYHTLMAVLKDQSLAIKEVILHAEEAYRLGNGGQLGAETLAYCYMKGKGVEKNLAKAERLIVEFEGDADLVMRAHCRMFADPEHPDIEEALNLLDQAYETAGVYTDIMLYLLYAESKKALSPKLHQRLKEELTEAEEDDYSFYCFLRGVQLALKPNADPNQVVKLFLGMKSHEHDLIYVWLSGYTTDVPLTLLSGILFDEQVDTDLRYHLAFRVVLERAMKKECDLTDCAFSWANSLAGDKYALRNQVLSHLLAIVGEGEYKKRKPAIKRFLSAYPELKQEGLANYLRAWIEATNPKVNWERLNHFADLVEQSQDSYSMVSTGHLLMKMIHPDCYNRGVKLEEKGLQISPLSRMDWLIQAMTGGQFADIFI